MLLHFFIKNNNNNRIPTIFYLVQQSLSNNCCIDILSHSSACGAFQGASWGIWSTWQRWWWWWWWWFWWRKCRAEAEQWRQAATLPQCPSRLVSWTGCWSPERWWGSTWEGRSRGTGRTCPSRSDQTIRTSKSGDLNPARNKGNEQKWRELVSIIKLVYTDFDRKIGTGEQELW